MHQSEVSEDQPQKKVKENPTALSSLKEHTVVVADSGKITEIEKYKPQDSTTNPTLILEAVNLPEYRDIVESAVRKGIDHFMNKKVQPLPTKRVPKKKQVLDEELPETQAPQPEKAVFDYSALTPAQQHEVVEHICDQMCVSFGIEILKRVPGYVSTEVDARLSFDKQGQINKAKQLIALYEEAGFSRDRVLIKLASTWEGIEAAKALKKEKIQCNMTLIFNHHQAIACAQAGVKLISPFVGRILDWFKKNRPDQDYKAANDPGVRLVSRVWQYFRKYNHQTIVMAASFRTIEETEYLCGCDRMTIPLALLEQLANAQGVEFKRHLDQALVDEFSEEKVVVDEKAFRWHVAVDPMANELLHNGIKRFADDIEKLERIVEAKVAQ